MSFKNDKILKYQDAQTNEMPRCPDEMPRQDALSTRCPDVTPDAQMSHQMPR